jgi:hypothetical protein
MSHREAILHAEHERIERAHADIKRQFRLARIGAHPAAEQPGDGKIGTYGQLRGKLEDDQANPRFIQTEPGIGYRIAD